MDKLTLTKQQLKELKKFINSRGFREPLIVMEILDHFACLVEEKLEANPGMSLDEAMQQAHGSFGVMGFRTIADAADVERNRRLNVEFKKNLRQMMRSPAIWLLLVLAGALYYQVYSWLRVVCVNEENANLITFWSGMLIWLIGKIVIFKRFKHVEYPYISGKDTGSIPDRLFAGVAFMIVMVLSVCPAEYWAYPIIVSVYILGVLVHIIAMYRTWQSTEQHYRDIEQMYAELDTQ